MKTRKKRLTKIVSILLCLSIIVGMSNDILAIENSLVKVNKKSLDECIIITALDWAELLYPELEMEIGDIHQINVSYNTSEVEYAVAYFVGVVPYGYAVVSFYDGHAIIKEASIEKGLEGVYTNLIDIVDENSEIASQDLKIKGNIVELVPMKYCVVTENEDKEIVSYDNYGLSYSEGEVEASYAAYYTTLNGFYIDNSNWISSNYKVDESTKVVLECYKGRWIFPEDTAIINTGSYACNVQAVYNISHWLRVNGYTATTMRQEYPKIWDYTNTYLIASPDGREEFSYGAGYFENTRDGFKEYLEKHQKCKNGEYTSVIVETSENLPENKPEKSWIRSSIKNNKPILYCYEVSKNVGHAIAIIGIMDAKKVSSGNTWTYLMVADSWSAKPTYFNYDYVDLYSYKAARFSLK